MFSVERFSDFRSVRVFLKQECQKLDLFSKTAKQMKFFFFFLRDLPDKIILCFVVYKKHYPPAPHDEVWRLDRMAKDGALHRKLAQAQIVTVEGL